ncbi:DEAD/DEAH box helicase [Leucobacter denitrificans]|uniref:DEAD/DEAH box helicase n=1 Tax=Leucobacter denitrificans TaxID=683042 RepID=A0A7G9S3T0_9MICO|nr:DEAD/DEAH box helicase [Leucobacter denitrificans]QNN62505.1 DEAD/DEAH box helicase [Leucobacter denitrificans]
MAQKKRRGFKAPKNYDPNRGRAPKRKYGARAESAGGADASSGNTRSPKNATDRRSSAGAQVGSGADSRERIDVRGGSSTKAEAPQQRKLGPRKFEAKLTTAEDTVGKTFASLGLGQNLVRTLGELGAESPFPIQVATIPDAIAGRDVLGRAETGSGKTIAFGAALVERLLSLKAQGVLGEKRSTKQEKPAKRGERIDRGKRPPARNPKALILAPTRELALQIDRTVQPLARSVGFYTAQLVGGVPIDPQVHALERGIDIVIGTPGRIRDLVQRRKLDLREVLVSVIDEADHLCELGFLDETQWALRQTERGGQRLLFSATLDRDVEELVAEFLSDPAAHEVPKTSSTVPHRVFLVLREDKEQAVLEFANLPGRVMMFCRTRVYAERVTELLSGAGISATSLHGNLSQARRERNLEKFSTGKSRVLVATDVAARGIHIDDVDVVVQLDPPDDSKTFVHRSGRTGRAGREGEVITLIPRTRQKRTREQLEEAGIEPKFFGDYEPGSSSKRR